MDALSEFTLNEVELGEVFGGQEEARAACGSGGLEPAEPYVMM